MHRYFKGVLERDGGGGKERGGGRKEEREREREREHRGESSLFSQKWSNDQLFSSSRETFSLCDSFFRFTSVCNMGPTQFLASTMVAHHWTSAYAEQPCTTCPSGWSVEFLLLGLPGGLILLCQGSSPNHPNLWHKYISSSMSSCLQR